MKNLKRASEITDDDVAFDAKVMQIFQIFWMFQSVNADHMVSSWKKVQKLISVPLCLFRSLEYVPEGSNKGGRVANPTSFDSYDMKSLQFRFGHGIFTGFKMARP